MPHWKCPSLCGKICRGFLSYSDLILISYYIFPSSPPFTCNESLIPSLLYTILILDFNFQIKTMRCSFLFFFQAILSTISCSEEERRKVEERTIGDLFFAILVGFLFRKMLFTLLCASTNPAPSIILLPHCWPTPCNGIPHYASISTMVNWSMPISHNMVFILLFILNHKLCRQLPAERMKFDIAASVIFKEPESSFERSFFLHVSTFSQRKFHFPANFWRKQWI